MANEEITISCLNDDCMIEIFDYLSFEEKLSIEAVSLQWQRLVELSWRNVRQLKIDILDFPNSKAVKKVIKKCGEYIKYLEIFVDEPEENFSYVKIFKEIIKNCKNINQFYLTDNLTEDKRYSKFNLGLFFKKNQEIHSLKLCHLELKGDCLLALNLNKITEISIDDCAFETNSYLHFLSNLKNLKKCDLSLDLTACVFQKGDIAFNYLNALNSSNCQSLSEFTLFIDDPINKLEVHELSSLLQKQKNLSKLDLTLYKDKLFLGCIDDRNPYYLNCFENLTVLEFRVYKLRDECIQKLSNKCINLTSLSIIVDKKYSLTSVGEESFSKFKKLQSFRFFNFVSKFRYVVNLDKILKIFSEYKKLTKLNIHNVEITIDTLNTINSLNLTYLRLSNCKITESELYHLINKLPNLQKLVIFSCQNLTSYNNILKIVSNLKLNRKDKHTLEVGLEDFIEHKINSTEIPMVRISYLPYNSYLVKEFQIN